MTKTTTAVLEDLRLYKEVLEEEPNQIFGWEKQEVEYYIEEILFYVRIDDDFCIKTLADRAKHHMKFIDQCLERYI